MALHERGRQARNGVEEDVALNWVGSTDGLIFTVITYLSIVLLANEETEREKKEKLFTARLNPFSANNSMLKRFGPFGRSLTLPQRNGNIIIK